MNAPGLPPSPVAELRTIELGAGDEPLLQRFFDDNPAYFMAVTGEPAGPDDAHDEIHGLPPAEFGFTRKWLVGYVDSAGSLVAMANVITDLLAPGVWHLGLFIVASARHGNGDAQRLHHGLERWAGDHGARWLRLGVVQGNTRAERFWRSMGYTQVRTREGVTMGKLTHTLRVMVKPFAGQTIDGLLSQVSRDRPEVPSTVVDFWAQFKASVGEVDDARFYEVFHFGDNETLANSLAQLVLSGRKRATAGLVWSFEDEARRPPRPGDLSVVTDWSGQPLCVIETRAVDEVPFDDVDAEFAATEGEGDGSLAYWREAHTEFFARECARIGRTPSGSMSIVCERFAVIYQGTTPPPVAATAQSRVRAA